MTTTSATDSRIVRRYPPALLEEPEITTTVQPFQQTAQARTITLRMAAVALNLHTALAQGATLSGIAEVSLQRDGDDYDLRPVVMRGEVAGGLDWGSDKAGEVQVQVTDFRSTQAEQVPRVAVDTDRWPSAADNAIGQRYPYIPERVPQGAGLAGLRGRGRPALPLPGRAGTIPERVCHLCQRRGRCRVLRACHGHVRPRREGHTGQVHRLRHQLGNMGRQRRRVRGRGPVRV